MSKHIDIKASSTVLSRYNLTFSFSFNYIYIYIFFYYEQTNATKTGSVKHVVTPAHRQNSWPKRE